MEKGIFYRIWIYLVGIINGITFRGVWVRRRRWVCYVGCVFRVGGEVIVFLVWEEWFDNIVNG